MQFIDIRFRDKVKSAPVNVRFRDITGPCVLHGFRFQLGTQAFKVSLVRDIFTESAAVSPSGARVSESTDLLDQITIEPNTDPAYPRMDSIYLVYVFGTNEAVATYEVVKGGQGTTVPQPNPNPLTHTLLGYIEVPPSSAILRTQSLLPVPYGFSKLDVAGPSHFYDVAIFDKAVQFKEIVTFANGSTAGGSGGGGGGPSSEPLMMDRYPYPIKATPGQKRFTTQTDYTKGSKSLFVFVDGVPQPPDAYQEIDSKTYDFNQTLSGGEWVYAFWFRSVNLFSVPVHDHNDLYYTKAQIADRSDRYYTNTLNGMTGRILAHNLGHLNYIVKGIVPTAKTVDVGDISVDKRTDSIIVYNTGTYRGEFDLTYAVTIL